MIVLAEEKGDQEKLLALCEKTAFGCKIASVAGCYGFDKGFACFWLDTTSQAVYMVFRLTPFCRCMGRLS